MVDHPMNFTVFLVVTNSYQLMPDGDVRTPKEAMRVGLLYVLKGICASKTVG